MKYAWTDGNQSGSFWHSNHLNGRSWSRYFVNNVWPKLPDQNIDFNNLTFYATKGKWRGIDCLFEPMVLEEK